MLDAFIIEKIRRERETAERGRRFQIEKRPPPPPEGWHDRHSQQRSEEEAPQRGVVVIDFGV